MCFLHCFNNSITFVPKPQQLATSSLNLITTIRHPLSLRPNSRTTTPPSSSHRPHLRMNSPPSSSSARPCTSAQSRPPPPLSPYTQTNGSNPITSLHHEHHHAYEPSMTIPIHAFGPSPSRNTAATTKGSSAINTINNNLLPATTTKRQQHTSSCFNTKQLRPSNRGQQH